MESTPVGIDLGTTNSAIARMNEAGRPEIILNEEGKPITPSVIFFGDEPPLIGDEAKEMQGLGEDEVAWIFKRSMGDPNFLLHLGGRDRTAVDLSALILEKLKRDAETALGTTITQAVITVPAYFNNTQREATIEAGRLAGLEVLRIINEPTAAALAFGLHNTTGEQTILVYDLGGGTFDVSLVKITPEEITVVATDGDHNLGGKDWDDRVASYLGQEFCNTHGTNPLEDNISFNDLLVRSEEAKKELSTRDNTRIAIHHDSHRESYELTRERFAELTRDLMERTQELVEQVLSDAKTDWNALTGVLLVGGSSRMPMVQEYVTQMSGKPPIMGVNVDEAVALGAAVQAGIDLAEKTGKKPSYFLGAPRRIQDVISHSLGMISLNEDRTKYTNSIIILKNGPIPAESTRPFQLQTRPGNENTCEVFVTQGETETPSHCAFLGKYVFSKIPHDSSGTTVLDITYQYDHNGVVQVSGVERKSQSPLHLQVDELPADMSWVELPPEIEEVIPKHIAVYLVIDVSGSMSGGPLNEAKQAAKAFVEKCDLSNMSIGLISFGSSAQTELKASQNAKKINQAIEGLAVTGSTNMTAGLDEAYGHLKKAGDVKFIVLLTDGYPDNQASAKTAAQKCHNDEVGVVAIGTGGANVDYLRQISSTDENAIFAGSGDLVSTFSSIAQAITEGKTGLRI